MGSIGAGELVLIFLVILLVFGAKRIPEIARGMGHGIREFKQATREIQRELSVDVDRPAYSPRPSDARTVDRAPAPATPAAAEVPTATVSKPPAD